MALIKSPLEQENLILMMKENAHLLELETMRMVVETEMI